jgi:hypothetical protein
MDAAQYENRCGTFRHTYREQVDAFVEAVDADGDNPALHAAPALARRMETRRTSKRHFVSSMSKRGVVRATQLWWPRRCPSWSWT